MKEIGDGQHTDDFRVFISSSDLSELQSQLEYPRLCENVKDTSNQI